MLTLSQAKRLLDRRGGEAVGEVAPIAAAHILGLSLRTLRQWRAEKIGPPCIVYPDGRRAYRLADLVRWRDRSVRLDDGEGGQ